MRIKNLSKIYKGRYDTVKALDNVTLNFDDKGLVFIVGASGSGKSTLMNMLSGIDKPSTGDVIIGGKSLYSTGNDELFGYRNSYVGLIFQDYNLIQDLTVYENIKLPLELLGETDFSIIDKVMKDIDIEAIRDSKVNEISSGQMQRVAIARALVKNSNVILADEPTGNLDTTNGDMVLSILKEVSKSKLVIVITHDDIAAKKFGDRIIEIEDGKILSDSSDVKENDNDELVTVEPICTFKKQVEFTKKFMKTYISRSLTIFLLLLLVPIVGGILSGYGFFRVGKSYGDHQDKYNEEYLILAMEKRGFDVYFDDETYADTFNKYKSTQLVQVYNTSVEIGKDEVLFGNQTDVYYSTTIDHVCIYQPGFFEIEGSAPSDYNEIVVTDYVMDCLYQQYGEEPEQITMFGYKYDIVGVANTNYEEFLNADMSKEFVRNAFLDNMYVYNSIIMDSAYYSDSEDPNSFVYRSKYFKDKVTFTSMNHEVKQLDVTFYRKSAKNVSLYTTTISGYPKVARNTIYISEALAKEFGFSGNYNSVVSKRTPGLTLYDRSRILCSFTIGGVFRSDKLEIVMDDTLFSQSDACKYMIDKIGNGRLLVKRDAKQYNEIVANENVVNRSFAYCEELNDTIYSGKITIFEILFTIIVIIIAFGAFINSYTLAQEKKKIGIKYSLGLSRKKIVLPYLLEYLFDIIVGTISAIVIAKIAFPLVMKFIVYRNTFDRNVFSFFYISWGTILGWCFVIAAIMIVSLLFMIRRIMKKSPVEIIKDI